jgi:hypothetical protein
MIIAFCFALVFASYGLTVLHLVEQLRFYEQDNKRLREILREEYGAWYCGSVASKELIKAQP